MLFILRFVFVAAVSHVYGTFGTYVGCFTKLIYHACNYCVLDFFFYVLLTTYYLSIRISIPVVSSAQIWKQPLEVFYRPAINLSLLLKAAELQCGFSEFSFKVSRELKEGGGGDSSALDKLSKSTGRKRGWRREWKVRQGRI